MIILDFGSGNSIDSKETIRNMVDSLDGFKCVVKYQLFKTAPPNKPLSHELFTYAYDYAAKKGYETTASVFDKDSLSFLREFDTPFIKIANRQDLYCLARGVGTPLVISYPSTAEMGKRKNVSPLCCVSKYPATMTDYLTRFSTEWLGKGISDHTDNFELYYTFEPDIYERHYVLKHDDRNPDAGVFAITPKELKYL